MSLGLLLVVAVLLSLERLCYVGIARATEVFQKCCHHPAVVCLGEPVEVVEKLFYGFKGVQFSVFLGWCYIYGNGALLPSDDVLALGVGSTLLVVGQTLNWSVFYRLGRHGAFYGNRLGYELPWHNGFPFGVFKHPQYVGTVLSIWGFFMIMRFPHEDWYWLPVLETVYYAVGTYFEE